jgi:hypothetical protein
MTDRSRRQESVSWFTGKECGGRRRPGPPRQSRVPLVPWNSIVPHPARVGRHSSQLVPDFSEGEILMANPSEPRSHPAPGAHRRWLLVVLPLAALAVSGCYHQPTRWDEVQKETRRNVPAVAKDAVPGSLFNKMFPKPEGDYDVVYTQEKPGFAQAKLVKKGDDLATLSIFDTASNPESVAKYKDSTETFAGYPISEIGSNGTGLLVGDRFQVQIRSVNANFSKFEREDWLKKFDLANLAKVQ